MVAEAIRRYRSGEEIDVEFAAWVTVALRELRVRDDAWARMLPEHGNAHSRLWADLTRLAQPGYVAAPASLLALDAGTLVMDRLRGSISPTVFLARCCVVTRWLQVVRAGSGSCA
jgi:hypothetical protein